MERAGADDNTTAPLPASDGVAAGGRHPVWPRLMSAVRPHRAVLSLGFIAIGAVADFMTVVMPAVHWFLLGSLTAIVLSLIAGGIWRRWRALCGRILLYMGMLFLVCLGFFAAQHPSNFWQRLLSIPQAVAGERGVLAEHIDQVAALQELLGLVHGIDDRVVQIDATTRQTLVTVDQIDATTRRIEGKVDDLNANVLRLMEMQKARDPGAVSAAEEADIPRSTIIEMARRILPTVEDADTALRELENAITTLIRLDEEGRHGTNLGGFIDAVLARVATLSRNGRFEEAAAAADDAFLTWERDEATRQAEEDERRQRSQTEGIRLLRALYDVDVLARKPAAAAGRLVQIIDLQHADADARYTALLSEQNALYEEGRDRGVNLPLEIAIELARVGLERARDANVRGAFANNLGNALVTLGARESGTARIEEAVEAYRAALSEWSRERVPLGWATTQNNLGVALQALGARESGTARLEAAVDAHRAALTEWTRERVPLDWAATQNNLGSALATLGARESGTVRLEAAVEAHRAALSEWTREHVPLDWAAAQNNLGAALQVLGERENGTTRLKAAVDAYRDALTELTRERVPLNWATTQNNLGNALRVLGERESGTARLEEAVDAYRAALTERTRERLPLGWAATQSNLGVALQVLAARESGTARLEAAVDAHRAALMELTRERVPLDWARTQNDLGVALLTLGERIGDRGLLSEALAAVDGALEVFTEAGADFYGEKATNLRAGILAALDR